MKKMNSTILIIDDEEYMHDSCSQVLIHEGCTIYDAYVGDEGMSLIREVHPDIVLLDLKLPKQSGINILREITSTHPTIVTVVITGYATIESAVEAMKYGASDFLPKPFTPDELRLIVKRGLDKRSLLLKTRQLEEENLRIKENCISIITHEMRGPLVAVAQYLEVLLWGVAGELEKKQKEILISSQHRIKWLLSLVNEWLSMARIQDNIVIEKLDCVHIRRILDEAIELVSVQAEGKHIDVVFDTPDDLPTLMGNSELLVHLFMNIYSNAIKYNHEYGKIITRVHDERDSIAVQVTDTGIGIPQESLPFIFDEFFRIRKKGIEAMKSSVETGTGLGLPIVKKIVDIHRGYISVDSQIDAGTTFTIHLPKKQSRSCQTESSIQEISE